MHMGWSHDLATGVAGIDQQHRELFQHFDRFQQACRQGQGRERLAELLGFLNEYVDVHFADEEALMSRIGFPQAAEHAAAHAAFRRKMAGLAAFLDARGPSIDLLVDTNQKVMLWLLEHIRKSDRALAAYLG